MAVEADPRSLNFDVILPACDRFERFAHTDRDGTEAQTHVEVKPVAFGRINAHIDIESAFSHVDGTHILRNVPHEAIDGLSINNRFQEGRNTPRRQPPGRRRRGPQGGVQPASPQLDAPHDLSHGLVVRAVGHRSARA